MVRRPKLYGHLIFYKKAESFYLNLVQVCCERMTTMTVLTGRCPPVLCTAWLPDKRKADKLREEIVTSLSIRDVGFAPKVGQIVLNGTNPGFLI